MSTTDPTPVITPRQAEVLATIQRLTEHAGYPPTIREIGAALGLASTGTVHHHVRVLEDVGLVSRSAGRPRARALEAGAAASNHQYLVL